MDTLNKLFERIPYPQSALAQRLLLLLLTAVVLSGTMSSIIWDLVEPVMYSRGEIAKHTVRSPRDFLVEDTINTEKKRSDAIAEIKAVFTLNDGQETAPAVQLSALFATIRQLATRTQGSAILDLPKERRSSVERQYQLDLVGDEWNVILNPALWAALQSAVVPLTSPILRKGIIANKQALHDALKSSGASLRKKSDGKESDLTSATSTYDVQEAIATLKMAFPERGFGKGELFDSVAKKLGLALLQPNMVFDAEETEKRINAAVDTIEPIYNRIQRGQVLVRAGDLVSPGQEIRLRQLREEQHSTELLRMTLGYVLLSAVVIAIIFQFTTTFWQGFKPSTKDLSMIAATLVGSFVMIKLHSILALALSYSFSTLDSDTFILATPLAAGGILLQATLGAPCVFLFTLSFSLLTGVFMEDSWLLLLLIVTGNMVGALSIKRCSRRSSFIVAGARVAGINALLVCCFLLFYPSLSGTENVARVIWAALGGFMGGIIGGGLTPIVEYLGGYITDIKLLELASLDRPLLRELSLQAPGTWNHSMVIAQLGEVAANAIGANGLLTRVGAFYHDVGKARKPAYFVENQVERENRHDKLPPSMSALIIKTHVKDGIEMAEAARLPQAVIDFIPQHHGTALIEYFYVKALKEAEEGSELVDETHYRYPGPRPQTKEAAILMLADGVEAASRTLADPTPAKIQGLVQKMINKVFVSGELGESNLTLRDLHVIAKNFTRVLTGIYHRRVEYSEPAEKTRGDSKVTRLPTPPRGGSEKDEALGEQTFTGQKRANSRNPSETEGSKRPQEGSGKKGSGNPAKEALKRLGI